MVHILGLFCIFHRIQVLKDNTTMTKIHTCRDIPDELVDVLKKDGIAMVDCEFTGSVVSMRTGTW